MDLPKISIDCLKRDVLFVLKKYPEGVPKANLFSLVHKLTGRSYTAKDYGVSKLCKLLNKWKDDIRFSFNRKSIMVHLKNPEQIVGDVVSGDSATNQLLPGMSATGTSSDTKPSSVSVETSQPVAGTSAALSEDRSLEISDQDREKHELLLSHSEAIRTWVREYMIANRNINISQKKLTSLLRMKLRKNFMVCRLSEENFGKFLDEECADILSRDKDKMIHSKIVKEVNEENDDDGDSSMKSMKEEQIKDMKEKLKLHIPELRHWLWNRLNTHNDITKLRNVTNFLNKKMNTSYGLANTLNRHTLPWFLAEFCSDIVCVQGRNKVQLIGPRPENPFMEKESEPLQKRLKQY